MVSIRATRAGRDKKARAGWARQDRFYPRDPSGPRHERVVRLAVAERVSIRATRAGRDDLLEVDRVAIGGVSIRATRAGRDLCGLAALGLRREVSIRATRAGRDPGGIVTAWSWCSFYPRDPSGPRRDTYELYMRGLYVSIRATRAGRDVFVINELEPLQARFYPRDPSGPRPGQRWGPSARTEFLSARPERAATVCRCHAVVSWLFLSARPERAATLSGGIEDVVRQVSIRATRAGRDSAFIRASRRARVSIRATRAGRDQLSLASSSA